MKKLIYILLLLFFAQISIGQQRGTLKTWKVQGGGGGHVDTTSLSNRINLKLAIADTTGKWLGAGTVIPAQVNIIEGTNITVTGTYPNITISSTGGGSTDTTSLSDRIDSKRDTSYHTNFYAESPLSVRDTIVLEGADTVHGVISSLDTLWTNNIIAPIMRHVNTNLSGISATNAASPLTTPTYDGSGQGVHPDIYYNPLGWNGYKWWMVFEPYPADSAFYENPSILVSNDNVTWIVPDGLTNPIVPLPDTIAETGAFNSDGDIFQGRDGSLNVVYRHSYVDESDVRQILLNVVTSYDGISWSEPYTIMNISSVIGASPSVIFFNNKYYLWYINNNGNSDSDRLYFMSSDSIKNGWSTAQACGLTRKRPASDNNKYLWHIDVLKNGDEYDMIATMAIDKVGGAGKMYLAKSHNMTDWTLSDTALISPLYPASGWDKYSVYRGTSFVLNNGQGLGIYYGGYTTTAGKDVWRIGYTEASLIKAPASTFDTTYIYNAIAAKFPYTGGVITGATSIQNGAATGSLVIGADVNASTRTANVRKLARITAPVYNSATANMVMLAADNTGTSNSLYFGGSPSASIQAANGIYFYTGTSSGDNGGVERANISSFGFSVTTPTGVSGTDSLIVKNGVLKAIPATYYAPASTAPKITSGSGAPSSTPAKVGDEYLDLTNKKDYKAFGTTSSADWILLN